jgi:hypothetical protein
VPPAPFPPEAIATAWRDAQASWETRVDLSPPEALAKQGEEHWGGREPLAYIDLSTRQVVVNFALLARIAPGSLTAVLAHEIGHHVRFPHTLGLAAQLAVLEQRLIPGLRQSLTNLFFDLQVNEEVGRTRARELGDVYRGFLATQKEPVSALFFFYLAIYEELWGLAAGTLAPAAEEAKLEKEYPGLRADARMFAQTFWALSSTYLQFVYFCSRFIRYIPTPETHGLRAPLAGDLPTPDADDLADALYGNAEVERAIAEAAKRGWVDAGKAGEAPGDPLATANKITEHLPGKERGTLREALVARHYKRLVDRHLVVVPPSQKAPDPYLPGTLSDWEIGDDPSRIDWNASVLASGAMAGARPLQRDLLAEPPDAIGAGPVAIEVYLDTSGSMPNPQVGLNAMTLAAQVLAASAIRKGGIVRGIIYSTECKVSPWMYDEDVARRFLLHYYGGGTDYPFSLLTKLAAEREDVVRVVVSDGDFLYNCRPAPARKLLAEGVARSRRFVALLALHPGQEEAARKQIGEATQLAPFRLVPVNDLAKFGEMAARLARGLFG